MLIRAVVKRAEGETLPLHSLEKQLLFSFVAGLTQAGWQLGSSCAWAQPQSSLVTELGHCWAASAHGRCLWAQTRPSQAFSSWLLRLLPPPALLQPLAPSYPSLGSSCALPQVFPEGEGSRSVSRLRPCWCLTALHGEIFQGGIFATCHCISFFFSYWPSRIPP